MASTLTHGPALQDELLSAFASKGSIKRFPAHAVIIKVDDDAD